MVLTKALGFFVADHHVIALSWRQSHRITRRSERYGKRIHRPQFPRLRSVLKNLSDAQEARAADAEPERLTKLTCHEA